MAQLGPRDAGTPVAGRGPSARVRGTAATAASRALPTAGPARWALVALAATLAIGGPFPQDALVPGSATDGATIERVTTAPSPADEPATGASAHTSPAVVDPAADVVPVSTEVEPPPPPAATEDAQARAARLAALEAAVVAAETAAADLAAAEQLTPRTPVRLPDGDHFFTPAPTGGSGSGARLHPDAPAGVVALVREHGNGAIPADALCAVPFARGALLQCDAAEALVELDEAFLKEFGAHLTVNSAYRSFQTQVGLRSTKGWLAAVPGTSNHGWGLAVDLGGIGGLGEFDSPKYRWLRENAERFGWHHPRAMQPGGGGPQEPWHWEFATA